MKSVEKRAEGRRRGEKKLWQQPGHTFLHKYAQDTYIFIWVPWFSVHNHKQTNTHTHTNKHPTSAWFLFKTAASSVVCNWRWLLAVDATVFGPLRVRWRVPSAKSHVQLAKTAKNGRETGIPRCSPNSIFINNAARQPRSITQRIEATHIIAKKKKEHEPQAGGWGWEFYGAGSINLAFTRLQKMCQQLRRQSKTTGFHLGSSRYMRSLQGQAMHWK